MSTLSSPPMMSPSPRIDLSKSKYNTETWFGRFFHFLDVTDPRTCLASRKQLEEASKLLEDYERALVNSKPEALWAAKKLRDSTFHPQTGEKIPIPFRLSFFTPMNMVIAYGLLIPNASMPTLVFWQFFNQAYNACVNYSNRNASNSMSDSQVVEGFLGATAISCSIIAGIHQIVKRSAHLPPRALSFIKLIAPFTAAGSAGGANVFLMRGNEINDGVDVFSEKGELLGKSPKAGKEAVTKTAISRVATSFPILIFPPLIMGVIERASFMKKWPILQVPMNIGVITMVLLTALPAAIAVFPSRIEKSVTDLEPEFHNRTDAEGYPITRVFFNKGL